MLNRSLLSIENILGGTQDLWTSCVQPVSGVFIGLRITGLLCATACPGLGRLSTELVLSTLVVRGLSTGFSTHTLAGWPSFDDGSSTLPTGVFITTIFLNKPLKVIV